MDLDKAGDMKICFEGYPLHVLVQKPFIFSSPEKLEMFQSWRRVFPQRSVIFAPDYLSMLGVLDLSDTIFISIDDFLGLRE